MKKIFVFLLFLSINVLAIAQPGMGEDPNEGDIPINSGILYLIFGAIALGIMKVKKKISPNK